MATRVVEGKKPYTGGTAIDIDENKVISLRLRDENNLIIYDEGDDEIYVDLQLDDEITPTDAFPIGVNTGRVVVDNGWDKAGTIISAKTTSGDVIKLVYADEGTLWIDNGTGTFKQIYFKSDVDAIITTLTTYINTELAKKQNGVASTTAPSNPSEGDLWYDTTNSAMKVWDGTAWQSVGTGGGGSDIEYVTQAEYTALLPGAESDGKHYFIYSTSGGGGWQPGVNTLAYWKLETDGDDYSGNNHDITWTSTPTYGTSGGTKSVATLDGSIIGYIASLGGSYSDYTFNVWCKSTSSTAFQQIFWNANTLAGAWEKNVYLNWNGTAKEQASRQDFGFQYRPGSGSYTHVYGTVNRALDTWYNVAVVGSSSGVKLYVNGTQVGSTANSSTINLVSGQNYVSGYYNVGEEDSGNQFYGCLSEYIIEDKERTAVEILQYYESTKANYGIS